MSFLQDAFIFCFYDMNAITRLSSWIKYGTETNLKEELPKINWTVSMTMTEFVQSNELLIIDLIIDALADDQDVDAMLIFEIGHHREAVEVVMKQLYEWYIMEDDFYMFCKH